jgi:predicted dehydrogenase
MKILSWGLIGAGDIARKRIAPALRDLPNCELVAISRSRADLAEDFAKEFGARKWFADWREMVADPDIDAVYIATPVHLHAEQTIAAAKAGKHVLCEKPMALTLGECDHMIAACRENSVKLGVAYYRRFYGVIERTKQIIASGEIGDVAVAQINAFEFFAPSADEPRRWLLDREKSGGGPMMDFGCHRIEVLTNLFGPIGRLTALASNKVLGRDVEDTATASFEFESGPIASVTVTHASIEPRDTLDIYGTKGAIHISALNLGEMTIRTGGNERYESHPPHDNFHQPLIDDFASAVLSGSEPLVDGESGRDVSRAIYQIYNVSGS